MASSKRRVAQHQQPRSSVARTRLRLLSAIRCWCIQDVAARLCCGCGCRSGCTDSRPPPCPCPHALAAELHIPRASKLSFPATLCGLPPPLERCGDLRRSGAAPRQVRTLCAVCAAHTTLPRHARGVPCALLRAEHASACLARRTSMRVEHRPQVAGSATQRAAAFGALLPFVPLAVTAALTSACLHPVPHQTHADLFYASVDCHLLQAVCKFS